MTSRSPTICSTMKDIDTNIENLLDGIAEAGSATVVSAYEARIEKLERKRIVLKERLENAVPAKGRLKGCMELA